MSWQLRALNLWLRLTEKPRLAREASVEAARARMETAAARFPMPRRPEAREAPLGALPALRIEGPPGSGLLLWIHGGAYCLGSSRTHAPMVGGLAAAAGIGAVIPDYRLAPEHVFPAALEDAVSAWAALRAEGVPAGRIVLGGDSAGGGLAFALLARLLAAGEEPPAGVLAFSPWVDLTLSGASLRELAHRDVLLPADRIVEIRDQYLGGADPADPDASPCRAAFPGAPPVLIQASTAEILLDDSRAMADRLRAEGGEVSLDLYPGLPHVWQFYGGFLPEADAALDSASRFARAALTRAIARSTS